MRQLRYVTQLLEYNLRKITPVSTIIKRSKYLFINILDRKYISDLKHVFVIGRERLSLMRFLMTVIKVSTKYMYNVGFFLSLCCLSKE